MPRTKDALPLPVAMLQSSVSARMKRRLFFRKVLEYSRSTYGLDRRSTLISIEKLAETLRRQKRVNEAIAILESARPVLDSTDGSGGLILYMIYDELAFLLQ